MLDRICDNCMNRVPSGVEKCPKCGIRFENTNPGGALPSGWVLGQRYTIGRYIEIDGEGVTYAAIDANTLQRVVIKEFMPVTLCTMRDENGTAAPKPGCEVLFKTTRMDYVDLYRTLLRLGLVEGLVQVIDLVEENNTAYAVFEKVEGPTLAEYLIKNSSEISVTHALTMLKPIMFGLEAMHSASVIHRGISPENIILESGGTAKLTGFATLALRQQGSEFRPKLYAGYSAPEQYAASEFEGRYTDIYSFGAVIYHLVTGEIPQSANERKMQDNMRPAKALSKEVPAYVSTALARALRVLPAERIQGVSDLRLSLSGDGGKKAKGPFGLSKNQLLVGGIAAGVVVVLVIVLLLVSIFSKDKDKNKDVSSSSISESSSVISEKMPDLVGKLYADVIKGSQYREFNFSQPIEEFDDTVEEGRIISHSPNAGEERDSETAIDLVVSKGAMPVAMPDFVKTSTTKEAAEKALQNLKIKYEIISEKNDGDKNEGEVLKTEPVAGEEVLPNKTIVKVYVAEKETKVEVPNIEGLSSGDIKIEMEKVGLKYSLKDVKNDKDYIMAGRGASTEPAIGTEVNVEETTVMVSVYDKFYMPDLSGYIDGDPMALGALLDTHKLVYVSKGKTVANKDATKNGLIAKIDFKANQEVTASTVVYIYLYKDYTPPVEQTPEPTATPQPEVGIEGDV